MPNSIDFQVGSKFMELAGGVEVNNLQEAIKKALQDYYDRAGLPYDEKDFPACEHCAHCESV